MFFMLLFKLGIGLKIIFWVNSIVGLMIIGLLGFVDIGVIG